MSVLSTELKFKKSFTVLDAPTNGGVLGSTIILSGVRHSIFPRVSRSERTLGITRLRKVFLANENNSQETAYGAMVYLNFPSTAGDRFYIALGTQTNTEADVLASPPQWTGCGKLDAIAAVGASSLQVLMENADFEFPVNSVLHISSNYKTGQTASPEVIPGASVVYSAGTWVGAAHNGSTVYPNGIWLGDGVVATDDGTGNEEWVTVAQSNPYTYDGNVVTIQLQDALVNSYGITNTWVGGCIGVSDIVASVTDISKVSASGSFSLLYPVIAYNKGCIEDDITITFTGSGTYTASGARSGSLGNGSIANAFSPINPATSTPYFLIPVGFFTGTWVAGNTLTFKTHPAALPIWIKEVVPAGTLQNSNNVFGLGYYWE